MQKVRKNIFAKYSEVKKWKNSLSKYFVIFFGTMEILCGTSFPANALANYLEEGDLKLMHTLHIPRQGPF